MANTHGKHIDVFINEFDLTSYFNNMDLSREVDTPEVTAFGNDDRVYIAGLKGGTASLSGFWDNTVILGSDVVLRATLGVATARTVTIGPEGTAIGDVLYLFSTHTTSYNITGAVDGVVEINADLQATAVMDAGFALHALTAETSTGDTNSSAVDNAAASSNGGVGHLHVSALGTPTTLDVDVEESSDDAVGDPYAAILSFTQVTTALTSERKAVAAGTTVERYLSTAWTIVGTSYTFAVGFARR